MLTFCQGLEGNYLSNDVLPKVQLVLFVKELHQKELGLWFLALLNASAHTDFYPLKSLPGKKNVNNPNIWIFIKNILKAKQSFDEISSSSAQPSEDGGIVITACSLKFEMFGFCFFFPPLSWVWVFRHWISGWQGLQGDFWVGVHLEGKEET